MEITRRAFIESVAALAVPTGKNPKGEILGSDNARGVPLTLHFPTVGLHGYGLITATVQFTEDHQSSITSIFCESHSKALLLQAKYLSDAQSIPGLKNVHISISGHSIPVHLTETGGALTCMAVGRDVLIFAGNSMESLKRLLSEKTPSHFRPTDFTVRSSVPMYLDRWDRYGLLYYMAPDATPPGTPDLGQTYDYGSVFSFVKDHGPAGLIPWVTPLTDDHSEGLTNLQDWDWVQEGARKRRVPVHLNTSISPPQLWLANRYREQTMLKSPQFLGGYYGVAHDSAVVGAMSWLSQEGWDAQFGIFQSIVKRFANASNIIGWLEPHGETGETPQKYFLDSGEYADEAWRTFLRKRYKTLAALSKRWCGDSTAIKSWAEVRTPEVAEFAGLEGDAIDLRGEWNVRYVPAPDGHAYTPDEARNLPSPPPVGRIPSEWFQPAYNDSDWDKLIAPGNDRMLYMARSPLVYRRKITIPSHWLEGNPQVFLTIWDLANRDRDVTEVYVNGQRIPEQSHLANEQHWSQFELTGALYKGENSFAILMPRAIICYRSYLSKGRQLFFPYMDEGRNARWVDFVEWNLETRGAQIRRGAQMIRQADPNSSINFMAPYDYYETIKKICQDYGGRFHDTGAMAGFWTEWNTLMMSGAGLPVSAEPGNGAPDPRNLQLFFGRWLTEGVNGVHYFQNWGDIAWNPDVLKAFNENLAMYRMIGKYHSPFARVATLYSNLNDCLIGFPWRSERAESIGGVYSLYDSAVQLIDYCPRDGVDAKDFSTPLVDKYRVIIDSNTSFMSEELVAGIEGFVRRGGVFITYGETGRHSPTTPDTWPIKRLTGYSTLRIFEWGDGRSLSVAPGQSILSLEEIPAGTRALGQSLKPESHDCLPLVNWDDGSIAIGMRPLGKGWVVSLTPQIRGPMFVAVIGAILRHFGIRDRVQAAVNPKPGLHLRQFTSNSGLFDVWVLFNESDTPCVTDLTFLQGVHPILLKEVVSGRKIEITRGSKADVVANISLNKWQSRMFLSPRRETDLAPVEWLRLQYGWWQGVLQPPRKTLPTPKEEQRFSVDLTEGWAYKNTQGLTDDQVAALTSPEVDDFHWERRELNLWLTPGEMGRKRHLLRRKFTVPEHWIKGEIVLCADLPAEQFFDQTRTFLDGVACFEGRKLLDGPYFNSFGGVLKPGTTHILSFDIQGEGSLTGSRGPAWLYWLPEPEERHDLAGEWMQYADAIHKIGAVRLPGTATGMYLSREVVIENRHRGQNVVIHLEATGDRFGVLINGMRLNSAGLWRGRSFQFDVTPMVNFGELNLIELAGSPGEKTVHDVEIRYYAKGEYP